MRPRRPHVDRRVPAMIGTPSLPFASRSAKDASGVMKLPPFAYACPTTLPEAVELLASRDAKAIAGGQSLVPMLAFRLAQPELLVDLRKLDRKSTRLNSSHSQISYAV